MRLCCFWHRELLRKHNVMRTALGILYTSGMLRIGVTRSAARKKIQSRLTATEPNMA